MLSSMCLLRFRHCSSACRGVLNPHLSSRFLLAAKGRNSFTSTTFQVNDGYAMIRNQKRSKDYVKAIKDCRKDFKGAVRLLNQMRQERQGSDVYAFASAISVCGNAGQWGEALALLSKMEYDNIEPNVVCFNSAISACGRAGKWQEALKLFSTLQKREITITVVSCNAAISACAKAGKWKEALEIFEDMDRMQNGTTTGNITS